MKSRVKSSKVVWLDRAKPSAARSARLSVRNRQQEVMQALSTELASKVGMPPIAAVAFAVDLGGGITRVFSMITPADAPALIEEMNSAVCELQQWLHAHSPRKKLGLE